MVEFDHLSEIVTGAEICIHYFEPQKKNDNKMWLTKKAKRPVTAKLSQSTNEVFYAVCCNSEGPVV